MTKIVGYRRLITEVKDSTDEHGIQHDIGVLRHYTADRIHNAYIATMYASILLLLCKNPRIKMALRDPQGKTLKQLTGGSCLNSWGFVNYDPMSSHVKPFIDPSAHAEMKKSSGYLNASLLRNIHVPLSDVHDSLDVDDILEKSDVIRRRLRISQLRATHVRAGLGTFDDATATERAETIHQSLLYLQANDPHSPLLKLLRNEANKALSHAGELTHVKQAEPLKEEGDGGGGEGGGEAGGCETQPAIYTGAIANFGYRLADGKIIRRRRRKYEPTKKFSKKFKLKQIELEKAKLGDQ